MQAQVVTARVPRFPALLFPALARVVRHRYTPCGCAPWPEGRTHTSESDSETEATTDYWQEVFDAVPARYSERPPYRLGYPVRLPSGRFLVLPIRRLPDRVHAVASLIANQASLAVSETLAGHMAERARTIDADLIAGLPTLGLGFASQVARLLGHTRYIPLGYSRKFWYDDRLSEPVSSITSPGAGKVLRLDPNLLPLLEGRRVLLVDDAISSGATALAAVRLLQGLGVKVAGLIVAMKQTKRWEIELRGTGLPVRGVYSCPLFRLGDRGWWPLAETQPEIP